MSLFMHGRSRYLGCRRFLLIRLLCLLLAAFLVPSLRCALADCNPETCEGVCCNGSCLGEGQDCCNGQAYSTTTQGCCNGQVYTLATHGCCNGVIFAKASECCYQGVVRSKVDTNGDGTADCCVLPVTSWAELAACPGTKKQPSSYTPTSNGCTWSPDNPCGLSNTSFVNCCNAHDIGYGTCNSNKGTVDTTFRNCMNAVCNAAGTPPGSTVWCQYYMGTCHGYASTYYTVVSSTDSYYQAAQVAACVCCVTED